MKTATLTLLVLFSLAGPASALAEEQTAGKAPEATVDTGSSAPATTPEASRPATCKGMMHAGKCQHGKSHGGMKHGGAQHGKGHDGKKHCAGKHRDGGHDKHRQVVQRLDMIEARMAKMEAMLESLMRR